MRQAHSRSTTLSQSSRKRRTNNLSEGLRQLSIESSRITFLPHTHNENNITFRDVQSLNRPRQLTSVLQDSINRYSTPPRILTKTPASQGVTHLEQKGSRMSYRDACMQKNCLSSTGGRLTSSTPEPALKRTSLNTPPSPGRVGPRGHPLLHPRNTTTLPLCRVSGNTTRANYGIHTTSYIQYLHEQAEEARRKEAEKNLQYYRMLIASTMLNRKATSAKRSSLGDKQYVGSPLAKEVTIDEEG